MKKRKLISIGGYSCKTNEWEEGIGRFRKNYTKYKTRNKVLQQWEEKADKIVEKLNNRGRFTINQFVNEFTTDKKSKTVFQFYDEIIETLKNTGKIGNSYVYRDSKKSLSKFTHKKDIDFFEIDYRLLKRWETYLLKKGVSPNSISVYIRTLRSLYNKAIKERYAHQEDYPFGKDYKIKALEEETSKRALPIEQIKNIIEFETIPETPEYHAKNYFLFSFHCMGMNFNDMAYLKWSSIQNGRIYYRRMKTRKLFTIKINQEIQGILDKYNHNRSNENYLFPILNDLVHESKEQKKVRIKTSLRDYNSDLKTIGTSLGINKLTSYVARHSWATILKKKGIPVSLISEGLGHKTELTTQIYLDSFGDDALDSINQNIIDINK